MLPSKDGIASIVAQLTALDEAGSAGFPPPPPLNPGEGGGRFDPMEPRVAKLEAHMEHVRAELAKLSTMPVEIATVKERVSHLPSKGFVVTAAVSTVGGVVALLGLLQKLGILT